MGTTYYADFDLTTGSNTGADAANAWKSMADIISGAPSAGDIVLCKGTDSISSTVSWSISGSVADGYIKLIGVDSSWDNVGGETRAIIDAQGNSFSALSITSDYLWLENFEIKNAGSSSTAYDGVVFVTGSYRDYHVLKNIYSHNNYGTGFNANEGYGRYCFFVQCRSSENASKGFEDTKYSAYLCCRADNNSGVGFYLAFDGVTKGCISHDNDIGFYFYSYNTFNGGENVAHGNTNDGFKYYNTSSIICSRSTDNGTGINYVGSGRLSVWYYYGDNTTEISGNYVDLGNVGNATVTLNGTDTDEGYTDSSSDDFTLTSDATYRRVAVSIP